MGMDVYGTAPVNPAGEYFRRNVWGWRPLADYLTTTFPHETADCVYWQFNDGDGLDADGAVRLADAIDRHVADGIAAAYITLRDARIAALPRETCGLCSGTGVRTDEVGVKYGYDRPRDEATGKGGCNGCSGQGTTEPRESHYALEVSDIVEFSTFIRASGGFKIH